MLKRECCVLIKYTAAQKGGNFMQFFKFEHLEITREILFHMEGLMSKDEQRFDKAVKYFLSEIPCPNPNVFLELMGGFGEKIVASNDGLFYVNTNHSFGGTELNVYHGYFNLDIPKLDEVFDLVELICP